jgi:hypothetical protein
MFGRAANLCTVTEAITRLVMAGTRRRLIRWDVITEVVARSPIWETAKQLESISHLELSRGEIDWCQVELTGWEEGVSGAGLIGRGGISVWRLLDTDEMLQNPRKLDSCLRSGECGERD